VKDECEQSCTVKEDKINADLKMIALKRKGSALSNAENSHFGTNARDKVVIA